MQPHVPFSSRWKIVLLSFLSLILAAQANAQEFSTPLEEGIPPAMECYIIDINGDTTDAKVMHAVSTARGITSIAVRRLSDNEKMKFKASEMKEIGFRNSGFVKAVSMLEQTSSIKKMAKANREEIRNREFIVYRSVLLPRGKRRVMMQLLNQEFNSGISVYYSAGSRKTSGIGVPVPGMPGQKLKVTGGLQRAYWLSKNDGKAMKIKRGNYNRKNFNKLFGDKAEMKLAFDRPYRFKELPLHVWHYHRLATGNTAGLALSR